MKSSLQAWRRGAGPMLRVGLAAALLGGCDEDASEMCDGMVCDADAFVSACALDPAACEPDPCADGGCAPRPNTGFGVFQFVFVDDLTDEVTADGAPGVDICSVFAVCDGVTMAGVAADLIVGEGYICGQPEPEGAPSCVADHTDASVALTAGRCEAGSMPSDFVSLGRFGRLVVLFARDLQGCTLQIVEGVGSTPHGEAGEVAVCNDAYGSECLTLGGHVELGRVLDGANPATIDVPVYE